MMLLRTLRAASIGCLIWSSSLSYGQELSSSLAAKFNHYGAAAMQEKVYVHTDKSFYLAGEVMWFKLYYVDGTLNRPADLSKVGYVEILDETQKPVMQGKIALKKGGGDGSFYLPSSLKAGHYTLRAYTNWMKNFGADLFFEQALTIVNPLKPLPGAAIDSVHQQHISFFPEGGNLVAGLTSKVAFKATDAYGRGMHFKGIVTNQRNETVANIEPIRQGMGSFSITPAAGDVYSATIRSDDGRETVAALPSVYEKGYVMRVEESGNALTVTIRSSATGNVFLLAHNKQVVKVAESKALVNGECVFTLKPATLGEGISQLTIFNEERQPVCERLFFRYPEKTLAINATSNGILYGSRQPVTLSVATQADGKHVPAQLSLSVYKLDSLPALEQPHILSYLWLSADLRGTVESPEYYFMAPRAEAKAAIDNLLLVHGWRRFDWSRILSNASPSFSYLPEFDGHLITGKISQAGSEVAAAETRTYLSVPGTKVQFYPMVSGKDGRIRFDVRDYYGPGEIIVQSETDSSYRIDIDNPFAEAYRGETLPPLKLASTTAGDLTEGSIDMQVQNAYFSEQLTRFAVPQIDTIPFYGSNSRQYLLDDYVRFTTTEEILREYVPDVAVRKSNGHFQLYVFNWEIERHYKSSPLVLLDGVPVSIDKIMGYDPLKMRRLQVVTDRFITGEFSYDGIISFTTYQGDLDALKLDAKAVILDYDGLQLKRDFYSPLYETAEQRASRLPDFRSQLFWKPDVETNASGKTMIRFFTSDVKGHFIGVLEGIDAQGYAGSSRFTFEVK